MSRQKGYIPCQGKRDIFHVKAKGIYYLAQQQYNLASWHRLFHIKTKWKNLDQHYENAMCIIVVASSLGMLSSTTHILRMLCASSLGMMSSATLLLASINVSMAVICPSPLVVLCSLQFPSWAGHYYWYFSIETLQSLTSLASNTGWDYAGKWSIANESWKYSCLIPDNIWKCCNRLDGKLNATLQVITLTPCCRDVACWRVLILT